MSFVEKLAERLRDALRLRRWFFERNMSGGLEFVHRGNTCCGVRNRELIVRVPPDETETALTESRTRAFACSLPAKQLSGPAAGQ